MMWLSRTLVLIGALNWGLIGFFRFDLVAFLFGGVDSWIARVVYAAVGLAGLAMLAGFFAREENRDRVEIR